MNKKEKVGIKNKNRGSTAIHPEMNICCLFMSVPHGGNARTEDENLLSLTLDL